MHMKNRASLGFTLIELLLVIVIVTILSSIAVPRIVLWIHKAKVKEVAQELLSDVELARTLAFEKGSSCVKFSSHSYAIYAPSNATNPVLQRQIPQDIEVSLTLATESSSKVLKFKKNKMPEKAGHISIEGYGENYEIVFNNISGRLYLKRE